MHHRPTARMTPDLMRCKIDVLQLINYGGVRSLWSSFLAETFLSREQIRHTDDGCQTIWNPVTFPLMRRRKSFSLFFFFFFKDFDFPKDSYNLDSLLFSLIYPWRGSAVFLCVKKGREKFRLTLMHSALHRAIRKIRNSNSFLETAFRLRAARFIFMSNRWRRVALQFSASVIWTWKIRIFN